MGAEALVVAAVVAALQVASKVLPGWVASWTGHASDEEAIEAAKASIPAGTESAADAQLGGVLTSLDESEGER